MTFVLRMSRFRGAILPAFLFLILELSFSSHANAQLAVEPATGSPQTANPCGIVGFQLHNLPADVTLSKIMWYGNGVYVGTTLQVTDVESFTVNANDGDWTFDIYAVAYYNGTSAQTPTYKQAIAGVGLNTIAQGMPANLNCLSPVTFSSSFVSALYVPEPDNVTSYKWSFPSSGWTITSSSMGSGNIAPSVTVTPDASSAGNATVTAILTCGFPVTSPVLAITRPTPPPTFGTIPTPLCNNSTNTFTVDAPCGATSYNWTLSGNAAATFQASGTQSLTTTSTSAVVSTGTVNTSDISLSVEAVYPGGATSTAVTDNIVTGGTPAPIVPKLVNGEDLVGTGPFTYSMVTGGSVIAYKWTVAPEATISGQTTGTVTFTTPKLNSGQSGDVYITAQYETACGGWSNSASYYFVDEGSGSSGFPPGGLSVQPRAGMSQLAIIANAQENTAAKGDSTAYALKSVLYTIKAANVYNTLGQLMKKASFGGANTTEYLDIHDLPNGIYFIQVMTSRGSTTEKFAVMR